MKTFYGRRDRTGCGIWVATSPHGGAADATALPGRGDAETKLSARPELFKGQAVPFDWGTDSPGTAHAAGALLVHLLGGGSAAASNIRAAFPILRRFLAALPADDFELSESFLLAFLQTACEMRAPPEAGR